MDREREREREREVGGIDQREKEGKERGASARPFGIPGPPRKEKNRRRIVHAACNDPVAPSREKFT